MIIKINTLQKGLHIYLKRTGLLRKRDNLIANIFNGHALYYTIGRLINMVHHLVF